MRTNFVLVLLKAIFRRPENVEKLKNVVTGEHREAVSTLDDNVLSTAVIFTCVLHWETRYFMLGLCRIK